MPRVPTYDNFQALPNTLPQVRVDAPALPPGGGSELQETGQRLMDAGNSAARIQLDALQQANQVRVNDAMNKAVQEKLRLTYDPQEGFVHLKGDAALTRPDGKSLDAEYSEKLNKRFDAIEAELGNDAQRQAFRQQANQINTQFLGSINSHVAKEYGDYQVGVQQGTIATATQQMGYAWGDAEAIGQSRNAIKAAVAEQGRLQGWSAQQVEANTVAALSPGHAIVIASAVDAGKLDYAREYMKQVQGELTPQARLKITETLDAGDFEKRTQDAADSIYTKHKGNTAAALAEVRATMSGKEEDATVQRIKAMDAERVALRERSQRDAADRAWQLVASGQRVPPSLLTAMDGRDAMAVTRQQNEGSPVKTDVSKWLEFTNKSPAQLAEMDPTTLLRDYRASFSDADLRNANEMILAAKGLHGKGKGSNDGLQLMSTTDLIKRSAREMGILPKTGDKIKPEQDAAFLQFQDAMQTKVNAWEAANGKKASPEVLAAMLQEEKVNKVRLDVWGTDPERAVISLTPEEQGKAYVVVPDGREVKLATIPIDYRASAIRRIRAKGLAPTEQLIASMWAADNPKK